MKVEKYPTHLALIPDGNRRWSEVRGLDIRAGYLKGIETLEDITKWALYNTPIEYFTVYGFSTENIRRSGSELSTLFKLYENEFRKVADDPDVHENKVRIRTIGMKELLPDSVLKAINYAEDRTKDYDKKTLQIAIGYGGREEIIRAIKQIASQVKSGLDLEKIDEHLVKENLYTDGTPYPDLIIRTKEQRLSNFLTWQSAYSELVFIDKLFPDLKVSDMQHALNEFAAREQRFGK